MSAFQYQTVVCYVPIDQYALSRHAAERFHHVQAARERAAQRRSERQQRRAERQSRGSYTTAV